MQVEQELQAKEESYLDYASAEDRQWNWSETHSGSRDWGFQQRKNIILYRGPFFWKRVLYRSDRLL